jgi:putative transposase
MPKKQYSPEEKLKIVLEALKEERLITDIASDYGIHHSVIHRWKRELLESADRIFAASKNAKAAAKEKRQQEEEMEKLYSQVGRLTTQLEWLKKNLLEFYPVNERKTMVDWDKSFLTIKEQAELLSVNRSGLYNQVKKPSKLEIKIKHLIDRIHTKHPFKGARRIRDDINDMELGFKVNRKRIQLADVSEIWDCLYQGAGIGSCSFAFPHLRGATWRFLHDLNVFCLGCCFLLFI